MATNTKVKDKHQLLMLVLRAIGAITLIIGAGGSLLDVLSDNASYPLVMTGLGMLLARRMYKYILKKRNRRAQQTNHDRL